MPSRRRRCASAQPSACRSPPDPAAKPPGRLTGLPAPCGPPLVTLLRSPVSRQTPRSLHLAAGPRSPTVNCRPDLVRRELTAASARPTGQDHPLPLSNSVRLLDNKLLASLPRDHFDLLAPLLTTVSLTQGIVLAEPGDEFEHVYFPQSGMLSLLVVMQDGKAVETATVGRERLVGGMAGLGLHCRLVRIRGVRRTVKLDDLVCTALQTSKLIIIGDQFGRAAGQPAHADHDRRRVRLHGCRLHWLDAGSGI
jgi:hypothetical protein